MNFLNKLVTVILCHASLSEGQFYRGDECSLKNGNSGICKLLGECREAVAGLRKGIYPVQCGYEGTESIVCCAQPKHPPVLSRTPGVIANEKCVEYSKYVWETKADPTLLADKDGLKQYSCPFNKQELVVGGEPVSEFPHMVQIGNDASGDLEWPCSGSLISKQYVLSAAHCLLNRLGGDARYARMGLVDLNIQGRMQLFNITQIILHPQYKPTSYYYDVGLAKLNKEATLNIFVRPACLYTINSSPSSKLITTGWGVTDFTGPKSEVLLRVVVELYDQPHCNNTFKQQAGTTKLMDGIKDEIMICARATPGFKDICQGSSGAPLQVSKNGEKEFSCMYEVVGVTSFGKLCGVNAPTVYTRISYYIKWIEDIIWPPTA